MSGFEFRETMSGSYRLASSPDDERPMSFTIRARSPRLLRFLGRREVEITGEVDAEAFADHRALRGTLGMDVALTGTLPYAFEFEGNDGAPYRFEGHKTVRLAALAESMTVLPGRIFDAAGREIATALLRFDMRNDLGRFLRSFRPQR